MKESAIKLLQNTASELRNQSAAQGHVVSSINQVIDQARSGFAKILNDERANGRMTERWNVALEKAEKAHGHKDDGSVILEAVTAIAQQYTSEAVHFLRNYQSELDRSRMHALGRAEGIEEALKLLIDARQGS